MLSGRNKVLGRIKQGGGLDSARAGQKTGVDTGFRRARCLVEKAHKNPVSQ